MRHVLEAHPLGGPAVGASGDLPHPLGQQPLGLLAVALGGPPNAADLAGRGNRDTSGRGAFGCRPLPLRRYEQRLHDDRRVGAPCALPQVGERRGRIGLQHRLDTLGAGQSAT